MSYKLFAMRGVFEILRFVLDDNMVKEDKTLWYSVYFVVNKIPLASSADEKYVFNTFTSSQRTS